MRWGYQNDYIADIRWLDKIKQFQDDEKVQKLEEKYIAVYITHEELRSVPAVEPFLVHIPFDLSAQSKEFILHIHFAVRGCSLALMAEQGVPLDVISRRLGHSDSRITMNIYFHVTKKMREKDNQKIKEV